MKASLAHVLSLKEDIHVKDKNRKRLLSLEKV
jgi:hypothetical protein